MHSCQNSYCLEKHRGLHQQHHCTAQVCSQREGLRALQDITALAERGQVDVPVPVNLLVRC